MWRWWSRNLPSHSSLMSKGRIVGDGNVQRGERGNLVIRDFHETQGLVRFVLTPMTKIGILRLGLQTERYSFSFGGNCGDP